MKFHAVRRLLSSGDPLLFMSSASFAEPGENGAFPINALFNAHVKIKLKF